LPADGLSCTTCQNPVASPITTTTYTVISTDANDCLSVDYVTVYIEAECGSVYIPNVFSPNGDNNNDILYVHGNCIISMEFMIYDRWGEKVFTSSSTDNGWDGNFRGKAMDQGVFVFNFKATLKNGNQISRKGNISLIR
jgi:gliding motility-associated-like protein